jgi:3-deoxy-D-manno-octulosonic-acid transferase
VIKGQQVRRLYNTLLYFLIAIGFPVILPIALSSKKRRKTILQRLGLVPLPAAMIRRKLLLSEEKIVWVHALSVGEVLSAVPLVKQLKERSHTRNIVFSASTKTGFDIANQYLNDSVIGIFYFPYDLKFSVKHIAEKIAPAVVVIVETDIWPNFLFEMKKRQTPVVLVNARLSNKSFIGYKRLDFFAKPLFLSFAKICTQSVEDAKRFQALDVPSNRIMFTGNIKFDQEFQFLSAKEIGDLRQWMQIQPSQKVLVAGSTHKGEESILLDAFSKMKSEFKDLVLVVTPRDPERARSVYRIFEAAGYSVRLMKEMEKKSADHRFDVIVVGILGILKKLYAIADIAFIGGSLIACGGHNPLEPASFAKPIIFGQDMSDFAEISKLLVDSGGAVSVHDSASLFEAVATLIRDDKKAIEIGERARQVFKANKGAVEKTLRVVETYL